MSDTECNGVDSDQDDEGLAIDPKLGCRVHFPSDVIRETYDTKVSDFVSKATACFLTTCAAVTTRPPPPVKCGVCTYCRLLQW
ncbi:unnamed protein product, partial [Brenthis ino]